MPNFKRRLLASCLSKKNVVGKCPHRLGAFLLQAEMPKPMKRKSLSEGFAMRPKAEEELVPARSVLRPQGLR